MGTDLAVCGPDGISGGSVIGDEVEAYVLAGHGGYQVEMWTHAGGDAYQVTRFARLGDAIRAAVDAARSCRPLAAWRRLGGQVAAAVHVQRDAGDERRP
jgi:hypothetical protein